MIHRRLRGEAAAPIMPKAPHFVACSSSSIDESDGSSDHHATEGSCASEGGDPPSLIGPRAAVLKRLCVSEAGSKLPGAVQDTSVRLEAACGAATISAAHRQLCSALQDLHGVIVTVDHALEEPWAQAPGAGGALLVEEGRQWLKDAQAYILHVQSQASSLVAADGSGVDDAWAYLLLESARCLDRIARHMSAGSGEGLSYGSVPLHGSAGGRRLISGACLPYAGFWAKAVAI